MCMMLPLLFVFVPGGRPRFWQSLDVVASTSNNVMHAGALAVGMWECVPCHASANKSRSTSTIKIV
jgi:hypothetical protein